MPLILLHDVPNAFDLPPLSTTAGQVAPCAGWILSARGTLCVVDGPGNVGFLLPAVDPVGMDVAAFDQHQRWLDAVNAAGGAVLVAADTALDITSVVDLVDRPGLRGGFVPSM